jgi:hypothetical protein
MLNRTIRFTILVNPDERQFIKLLSERLSRTQADAIRYLIRSAVKDLEIRFQSNGLNSPQTEDSLDDQTTPVY